MSARQARRRGTDLDLDLILGIVLIVLGILALVGSFSLGDIIWLAAVAAIIVGILILANVMAGSQMGGILLLVIGILLLVLRFDWIPKDVRPYLDLILGIILILIGVLKLTRRW